MTNSRKRNKRNPTFQYANLESREMLATVSIESIGGRQTLVIDGDPTRDVAIVEDASNDRVRVTLNGQASFHSKANFERIRFLGRSGDDFFRNSTDVDSTAFGHNGNDTLFGGNGNNWMQGGDGNDRLVGGDRNDQLRGRAGNDIIEGGRRHDRIFGGEGNDQIDGGSGDDFIRGESGADQIFGFNGDDRIGGGSGNDTIDAGNGNDTVQYTNNYSNYAVFGTTTLTVEDNSNANGSDIVTGSEWYQFSNVTLSVENVLTSDRQITIRPVILSNSNGSNSAEFFGNDSQEAEVKMLIDEIFAQADIDVVFEQERRWNNSFANVGNSGGGVRPTSDLQTIVQNGDAGGFGSSDSRVIDVYFVEVAPGFDDLGENFVNGLAFISASGVGLHVGDNLAGSQAGREIIARVFAHEVGHNLGLEHVDGPNNLMSEQNGNTALTQAQVNEIRDSEFAVPV